MLERNREFFRTEEVSWNKDRSTTHERKTPQRKISEFFFLDTLKTTFFQ